MSSEGIDAVPAGVDDTPSPLDTGTRWRIFGYLTILMVMTGFGSPGGWFINLPVSFFLKNRLHLSAHEVARFHLIAFAPVYVSFLFGLARDSLNPFGMRDRGFLVLFGTICAALYVGFAFTPFSYVTLLAAGVLLRCAFLFITSAQRGLVSAMGQQHVMTGAMSTLWNVVDTVPLLASMLLGGMLSQKLEGASAPAAARLLFLLGAMIMLGIALYGLWRPRVVFDNLHAEHKAEIHPLRDGRRLARHWPVYPAILIWLLWNFAPGSATPLQYYLQNTLHASDAQWGEWNAIFAVGFVPTFLLYGWLCRRFALKHLLWWGTLTGIPQMIPLAFIHTVSGSLWAAGLIGLLGGVPSAAFIDLIMRSCPRGLQGTVMMFAAAAYEISTRFGDVLGTWLYDNLGGFNSCVIAVTVVYALILPVLLMVPAGLVATTDGEVSA